MAPNEVIELEKFAPKLLDFADDAGDNLNFQPRNNSCFQNKQSVKNIQNFSFS